MPDAKQVAYDALREMYAEAEPPADFDEILENADEQPEGWYQNHYLNGDRQREIVDKHVEEAGLNAQEEMAVHWTAILNYGPASTPPEERADG